MVSVLQKQAILAIVNIFETGEGLGDYSMVTLIPGDTGGLTYGRSQTTLKSGNLGRMLQLYVDREGALLGPRIAFFMPRVRAKDDGLGHDAYFKNLLRTAADDRLMREVQDAFFDAHYYEKACAVADRQGIRTPLGLAVVFDSLVHGSWPAMRRHTEAEHGSVATLGEERWINAYLAVRRDWLANHRRSDLRATVYRMDAFLGLVDLGAWDMPLPMIVRNHVIDEASLRALPSRVHDGPPLGSRVLGVRSPLLRGFDVRLVQLALSHPDIGESTQSDGIFGPMTERCVRRFQRLSRLPETGTVANEEIARLPV